VRIEPALIQRRPNTAPRWRRLRPAGGAPLPERWLGDADRHPRRGADAAPSPDLDRTADAEIERAKRYGRAVKADRTIAEYPPTVARYAATLAGVRAIATIRRRTIAISQAHQERGFEPPTAHKVVREVLADIARTNGSAQRKKSALTVDLLRAARCSRSTRQRSRASATARCCCWASPARYAGYGDRNESAGSTFTENRRARPCAFCVCPGRRFDVRSLLARFDRRCARARNRSPQAGRERSDSRSRQRSRRNDEPSPICSLTSFEYCARCCCRCQAE
jgi:hypothetical protein